MLVPMACEPMGTVVAAAEAGIPANRLGVLGDGCGTLPAAPRGTGDTGSEGITDTWFHCCQWLVSPSGGGTPPAPLLAWPSRGRDLAGLRAAEASAVLGCKARCAAAQSSLLLCPRPLPAEGPPCGDTLCDPRKADDEAAGGRTSARVLDAANLAASRPPILGAANSAMEVATLETGCVDDRFSGSSSGSASSWAISSNSIDCGSPTSPLLRDRAACSSSEDASSIRSANARTPCILRSCASRC